MAGLWKTVRIPAAALLGVAVAAVPLVLRTAPGAVWIGALPASSILVWYAFLSVTESLRLQGSMWHRVVVSLGLYLLVGVVFVLSLSLGVSPFQLGRFGWAYVVFVVAWPPMLMWVVFQSLSWFPAS